MADNVAVTAGSGTTIATDQVGTAHYQRVKLTDGTADSSTAIAAGGGVEAAALRVTIATDSTGVLSVDDNGSSLTVDGTVTVAASENLVGLVGASDIVVTVTPTMDTNAYASGDLLFDSTEVAAAVRANGYTAILQSVTIIDKDDQGVAFTLLIANAATDFGTVNSAPDADDTEVATIVGHVPVATTDYIDMGGAKVACIRNLGLLVKAGAATTSLYIAGLNGTGTPTYTASGLVFQLGFLRS